jgi:hypothetical protein
MDWIDKTHLDTFAQRQDARNLLPKLVRDLILATLDTRPTEIRFHFGEAGEVRGFDGILTSAGSPPFVPDGQSVWEFGCSKEYGEKTKNDLNKRTIQLQEDRNIGEITLVLVNPWHYDNPKKLRNDWLKEINSERKWKEVKLIDGADLKHWLMVAPGVGALWATDYFHVYPRDVCSIDEWWSRYANQTASPIPEKLLLAGRGEQQVQIVGRLAELKPDRLQIVADSAHEALAFVIAAIREAEPDKRDVLRARTLVVESMDAAKEIDRRKGTTGKIVHLLDPAAASAGFLATIAPTVIPFGRANGADDNARVRLDRPARHAFAEVLAASGGISEDEAAQLAAGCGRSVTVLRRLRGGLGIRPDWTTAGAGGRDLIPALLAGAWDQSRADDRKALAQLAGLQDHDEYTERIQRHLTCDDPPLEKEGSVWNVRAPMDAFVLLGEHVTRRDLDRFRAVCHAVLGEIDRRLDAEDDPVAMAKEGLRCSTWLRQGLARTLLLASTMHKPARFGHAVFNGDTEVTRWVEEIVRNLPGFDSDIRLLASLKDELPLLAEAAPAPFVDAVSRFLDRGAQAVEPLFRERAAFLTSDTRHVHLLWALETIAWDPNWFPRATALMARLAAADPGGQLANRPISSLAEIFLPMFPHTDADLGTRLRCLAGIVQTNPQVGWDLCLRLLPDGSGISFGTHRPFIRESNARTTWASAAEAGAMVGAAASHLLALADADANRWCEILPKLPDLADERFAMAVDRLDKAFGRFSDADRNRVWQRLHEVTANHASHQHMEWALPSGALGRLQGLLRDQMPEDPVLRSASLFQADYREAVIGPDGAVVPEGRVAEERRQAVEDVRRNQGHEGIFRLVEAAPHSRLILPLVVDLLRTPTDCIDLCRAALERSGEFGERFASVLSRVAHGHFGRDWTAAIVSVRPTISLAAVVILLEGLPHEDATWDTVAALGADVDAAYWRRCTPWLPTDATPGTRERLVRRLLEAGRAVAALPSMERTDALPAKLVLAVLDRVVEEINETPQKADNSMLGHWIQRLFEMLRQRPDVGQSDLVRLELVYLPFLVRGGRAEQSLTLFDAIATDPALYVALLTMVFRSATGEQPEPTAEDVARAKFAYRALDAFKTVPGSDGGSIDSAVLRTWVDGVLKLSADADRKAIGELHVGKVLAHAPMDQNDGAWPAQPIRDILEQIKSDEVERGVFTERFNMRGMYSKSLYEGGLQERALAQKNRHWASLCAQWPRTSAMLSRIAQDWDMQAKQEDDRARQDMMRD